jgi:hypothetical protein
MMDLKHLTRTASCITLMVVAVACAKKEESMAAPAAMSEQSRASDAAPAPAPAPEMKPAAPAAADKAVTTATTAEQMGSSAATFVDGERKFIRKASATFNVKDVYVAALGIEDTVAAHGGFVVKNNISTVSVNQESHAIGDGKLMELNEYKVQGQLTVRVPSAKTQEFLRAIVSHIVFLDQRNFSAHDAQFDLLRRQLDAIRNQETQHDLGQAIQEGGKLAQRTDAISTRGDVKAARDAALLEKKEFEDQVAFSTIDLTLYQPSKVLQTERVDIESVFLKARPGFFPRMGEKLSGGWNGLLDFVLALAGIWPVLLIGGAIGAVVWRWRRAKR